MSEVLTINNWINNEEVPAEKYRDAIDPGNGEVVARVAQGTQETVDLAVQAAHKAQKAWAKLPLETRKAYAQKCLEITQESMGDLIELAIRDTGYERRLANVDFFIAIGSWQYYLSVIDKFLEPEKVTGDDFDALIYKVPKGVCGAIVPWNMPICLTMSKLPLAILTGNTFVLKPPTDAPVALTLLVQRYAKVLPAGVLNVVNGSGGVVGPAICDHPLVNKVGFTGGTEGGRDVAIRCARGLKTSTLELGGNDAAVVLADADMDFVVNNMIAGTLDRSGQICFAIKRIYVPNDQLDAYFEKFCEVFGNIKTGYGTNEEAYYGPLMNKSQYDWITSLIEDTKAQPDAEIRAVGGFANPELLDKGYYIQPHIVKTRNNSLKVVQEEQFGPIIPLIGYDTEEQAIEWANDNQFGLCSSIWATDTAHAAELGIGIEAGQTFINKHSLYALSYGIPFGGFKDSGIGREFTGDLSLGAYVEYHTVKVFK